MQESIEKLGHKAVDVHRDMAAPMTGDDRAMTAIQILQTSARDIQRRIEEHQRLIDAALEGGDVKDMLNACPPLDCPHRRKFRKTCVEAISVLEDTRRAFKSKQLEALRKNLIGALAEDA